jgi:hypothetical protein
MRAVLLALVLLLVTGCVTGDPIAANPQVADPAATDAPFVAYPARIDMRIDPKNAAEFILNPTPLGEDGYPRGMVVTIEVLPQEGWRVDDWAGPVFDVAGNVAKITMESSHTVVARMKRTTPMAASTDTSILPTVSVVTKDDDNSAPVAVDDIVDWADLIDNGYDIQLLQGITFAVTENDTDADGHALTIDSVTQGVNGSVDIVSGFPGCPPVCGRVTYNPDGSFPPLDTFTYTVRDGYGGTDTGTVRVINDDEPTLPNSLIVAFDSGVEGETWGNGTFFRCDSGASCGVLSSGIFGGREVYVKPHANSDNPNDDWYWAYIFHKWDAESWIIQYVSPALTDSAGNYLWNAHRYSDRENPWGDWGDLTVLQGS